jgi:hypothetical protein
LGRRRLLNDDRLLRLRNRNHLDRSRLRRKPLRCRRIVLLTLRGIPEDHGTAAVLVIQRFNVSRISSSAVPLDLANHVQVGMLEEGSSPLGPARVGPVRDGILLGSRRNLAVGFVVEYSPAMVFRPIQHINAYDWIGVEAGGVFVKEPLRRAAGKLRRLGCAGKGEHGDSSKQREFGHASWASLPSACEIMRWGEAGRKTCQGVPFFCAIGPFAGRRMCRSLQIAAAEELQGAAPVATRAGES